MLIFGLLLQRSKACLVGSRSFHMPALDGGQLVTKLLDGSLAFCVIAFLQTIQPLQQRRSTFLLLALGGRQLVAKLLDRSLPICANCFPAGGGLRRCDSSCW